MPVTQGFNSRKWKTQTKRGGSSPNPERIGGVIRGIGSTCMDPGELTSGQRKAICMIQQGTWP